VTPLRLLPRGSWPEARYVASSLRMETVGGALLLRLHRVAAHRQDSRRDGDGVPDVYGKRPGDRLL